MEMRAAETDSKVPSSCLTSATIENLMTTVCIHILFFYSHNKSLLIEYNRNQSVIISHWWFLHRIKYNHIIVFKNLNKAGTQNSK